MTLTAPIEGFSQFTDLRRAAANDDPEVLREVAGQFEALFLESMLKNMREASLGDPLLGNSEQFEMFQGLMDQQLSVEMASGKGIGLAEMLVRQLGDESPESVAPIKKSFPIARNPEPAWSSPEEFAKDIWPHAKQAAAKIGVEPEAIVAQAALETGWGAHVMPSRDGNSSYNLFGIKGGNGWQGGETVRRTIEFEDGIARQQHARFRSYDDVGAAFADYTQFIAENPRYENVRDHGNDSQSFATALQDSGYATDPEYAAKINQILEGPTMRRVLAGLKPGDENA